MTSPVSRAVAQYVSNLNMGTVLVLGSVTASSGGVPTRVSIGSGQIVALPRTLNTDTYATGDLVLIAMLNRPVLLGKVIENP